MARSRLVLWALRLALAVVLVVAGIRLWVSAWHLPIEAGGLLFGPMLLAAGFLCFWLALWCLLPRFRRTDGPGLWSSFARLLRF